MRRDVFLMGLFLMKGQGVYAVFMPFLRNEYSKIFKVFFTLTLDTEILIFMIK